MRNNIWFLLLGLAACGALGCGQASGDQTAPVKYAFQLTPEELALARALAEHAWHTDTLASGPKTVFIKVDLLPDSQADSTQRLVMVHHYRYHTDETIFTMIDLHRHEVLEREIQAHYPTGLAAVEVERAITLARHEPRLRPLLDALPTTFDARPIQYANPHEPLFGHRVVHLLLLQGGHTLVTPRVLVDLTTESVHLETSRDNQE